ncbi:uncharacterized protein J4E79_007866 [Alternaria viburni]|uniref:uncharacterized protein n=1 Tax=Alternaria viburni TaxID=566460 RepID=UPI0020C2EA94|nr:uncharacterized protein J4E79_007866 [Alternaria viburni]KAI4657249.1 hypothetical protein J4E79_007866 [Alternaria viburni]
MSQIRKELWQELMDGFTYNEPEVILDCLDRGAPLDECNDEGDYPIHLAARNNNIDILLRTRFVAADNIYLPKTLLPENLAGETPLEIACNANAHEAVRWIMGELPQDYERAHAAVSRAFKLAIVGEREGLLKILQQSWPDWRALKIKTGTTSKTTPLRFAIDEGKVKSAYRLVNPIVTAKRQPHARRIFDMMWKSQLEEGGYLEIILDQDQKSIDLIPYAIVDEVMRSSTISNAEILEILLNVGIDISAVLRQSIYYAVRPTTHPHQDNNVWEKVLREDHVIEPKDLDSILSFEIPADSSPIPEVEVKKDSMRAALSLRGGQDWSGVVKASTSASIEDLEKFMYSEDGTMLQRMLSLKDKDGYSLLRFTISHGMNDPVEKQKQRLEYTDLLLQHGIEVAVPDLMAARERLFHHEGTLATFMLLASYITHDVALDLLYKMCSESWNRNGIHHSTFDLIHILLRCGVDPTLLNGSGKTPRIALRDTMAERPTKKVPMMDERAMKRLEVTNRARASRISKLLLRWENHVKGSGGNNPLEMHDFDWQALRQSIGDEEIWAWLVQKNPEGYKVIEYWHG